MRKVAMLFALFFLPLMCAAQTYTTTADGCGNKPMACSLPVTDQDGVPSTVFLDNRAPYRLGIVGFNYGTTNYYEVHGAYNFPVQDAHTPFYGGGTYDSNDTTVHGEFQVYAYYVSLCSGRGCGGTLGWHYRILGGSTIGVK